MTIRKAFHKWLDANDYKIDDDYERHQRFVEWIKSNEADPDIDPVLINIWYEIYYTQLLFMKNKEWMEKKQSDENRFDKFSNLKGSSFSDTDIIDLMNFALSRRAPSFEKSNPDTRLFTFRVYDEYISDYEAGLLPNATEKSYNIVKEGYEALKKELENEKNED